MFNNCKQLLVNAKSYTFNDLEKLTGNIKHDLQLIMLIVMLSLSHSLIVYHFRYI